MSKDWGVKRVVVIEQDNCVWCVRLHPHIERLAENVGFPLEFINVSKDWTEAQEWGVQSTPTAFVIDELSNIVGRYSTVGGGIPAVINGVKEHFNG